MGDAIRIGREIQCLPYGGFVMTKYAVILAIMDMASAKSDVNGWNKKKYIFINFALKSEKNTKHIFKNV